MNSKNKGNSFEREIAKKISLFLTNGERNDTVWRTVNSGGFSTVRKSKNLITENQEGDLTSISKESEYFFNFYCIECKRYKEVDLYNIFTNNSKINEWWNKLKNECGNKIPILIFKPNRKLIYCILPDYNEYEYLNNNFSNYFKFKINEDNLIMILFDELFKLKKDI